MRLPECLSALALLLLSLGPAASAHAQPSGDGFAPPPHATPSTEDLFDEAASDAGEEEEDYRPVTDLAAVNAAHEAYLKQTDLQLQRPEEDLTFEPPPRPPGWLAAIGRFIDSLGPLFQVIFYVAIGAAVAGVLYFLFGEALRIRLGLRKAPKDKRSDDDIGYRPDAGRARSLLDEADALARAGRFAEAVHLLLFRSIEDIQQQTDGDVPRSLTAREIAGLDKLPDLARGALAPIIRIVEQSFFGGRPVDETGWTSARKSYEDFAFGAVWT